MVSWDMLNERREPGNPDSRRSRDTLPEGSSVIAMILDTSDDKFII